MTDKRKVQLGVEVDPAGSKKGFKQIKDDAQDMAQGVVQAGQAAGKAIDGIGDGGDAAAKKLEAATRNMAQSIQRTTALAEAGSRANSKFFEVRAAQLGIPIASLKPYLAELDAVVAKQAQVSAALKSTGIQFNEYGLSVKQTTAALRQVPAQLTDIIVSLQSGQAPLTVLLQQGGQLKDVFGGIGPAAKALGGYVVGLINPFSLAAAAAGGLAFAYHEGSKESQAYGRALIMTGNAAGTSVSQLQDMAARIDGVTGTQRAAAEALAQMAGSGRIASRNLEEFTAVAMKMESAVGISIADTVKNFEALGKSPVEASRKLDEQYRYLTAAVYEQIQALAAQGREEEAAALAQKTFSDEFKKRTDEVVGSLGLIERGWKAVKKGASEAIDEMLQIGRATTLTDQIKGIDSKIESYNPLSLFGPNLDQLKAQREAIIETMRLEQRAATSTGERAAIQNAAVAAIDAVTKANDRGLTKQQQMNKALDEYRGNLEKIRAANPKSDLLDQSLITKTEAAIREQFKERGGLNNTEVANLKARILGEQQYLDLLKQHGAAAEKLNQGEKDALKYSEQLKGSLDAKTRARVQELLVQSQISAGILKETDALKESIKAKDEFQKLRDKEAASIGAEIVKINEKAQAIEDEIAKYGLGREAIDSLAISRLEEKKAVLLQFDGSEARIALLDQEIEARKRLAKAMDGKEAKEDAAKAAKKLAEEWKRRVEDIEKSLTDALMRGFESGKGFGQNLIDTIKNMFKTLVLRPIISAVVNPVASTITGALGLAGTANAGASTMGSIGTGSSIYNAGTGIAGMSGGFVNGLSAWGAEGSVTGMLSNPGLYTGAELLGAVAPIVLGIAALAVVIDSFMDDGPEENTALRFASNNTPGNISINRRGNEGSNDTYIGATGKGAFGTFGVDETFWMEARQPIVTAFVKQVAATDDLLAKYLSDSERERVTKYVTGKTSTAGTGPEGSDPSKALGNVFADRITNVFEGIETGLSKYIDGFKGSVQELEAEAVTLLNFRKNIADYSKVFGEPVSFDSFAAFKGEAESLGTAIMRLAGEFNVTNAVAGALGQDAKTAFGAVGLASTEARERLIKLAGGIDNLAAGTTFFVQNFLTEAQQMAPLIAQVTTTMESLGFASVDTKEEFATLAMGLDLSTEAGATLYAKLMEVAPGLLTVANYTDSLAQKAKDLATASSNLDIEHMELTGDTTGATAARRAMALENADPSLRAQMTRNFEAQDAKATIERAMSDISTAFSTLQNAVEAERTAVTNAYNASVNALNERIQDVNGSISKLSSLSSTLKSTINSMRLPSDLATERASAQAQIQTALAIARAGGVLPDAGELQSALSILSRPNEELYGSFVDFQREYLRDRGAIAELASITDAQMSVEEKTLQSLQDQLAATEAGYLAEMERLDGVLTYAQQQIDAINGVNNSVLSVVDAIINFNKASIEAGGGVIGAPAGTGFTGFGVPAVDDAMRAAAPYGDNAYVFIPGINDFAAKMANAANVAEILGWTVDRAMEHLSGQSVSYWQAAQNAYDAGMHPTTSSIPLLDVGTNYVQSSGLAMIHEGEAVVPKAYNPAAGGGNADTRRLESLVEALTAEVKRLQDVVADGNENTRQLSEQFDNLTEGGNAMRTEVVA